MNDAPNATAPAADFSEGTDGVKAVDDAVAPAGGTSPLTQRQLDGVVEPDACDARFRTGRPTAAVAFGARGYRPRISIEEDVVEGRDD